MCFQMSMHVIITDRNNGQNYDNKTQNYPFKRANIYNHPEHELI